MKEPCKLILLGVILLLLDQLTKSLVRLFFSPSTTVPLIKNIFHLTFAQNTGAIFGSFKGTNSLLIWLTLIAIGLILYLWDQFPKTRCSQLFLVLILVGSIGNLIDRISLGYVTDFLDFRFWPIFNLSDSMVSIGILGVVIAILRGEREEKKAIEKPRKIAQKSVGKKR
jgi:signal peptidase II